MVWPNNEARWLKFRKAFVVLTLLLFVANILTWKRVLVFGNDPPFRPLASVFLSAGLLLQALASLVQRRSYPLAYLLLGSSMIAFWFCFKAL